MMTNEKLSGPGKMSESCQLLSTPNPKSNSMELGLGLDINIVVT